VELVILDRVEGVNGKLTGLITSMSIGNCSRIKKEATRCLRLL
jgi:hypothetical protein